MRSRRTALAMLLSAGFCAAPAAVAAGRESGPYAVVGGSVFRENGFSFPGVTVTLVPKPSEEAAAGGQKSKKRVRKLEAATDARGEFAFRVAPQAGTYVVTASMKGFQAVSKEVSVSGEERIDVTLVLVAESK